jgi:hypothetical protein
MREFVDGRVGKRQHRKALVFSERSGHRGNTRNDCPGLSGPRTSLHEGASRVIGNGTLFRCQVHASLTFKIASRM